MIKRKWWLGLKANKIIINDLLRQDSNQRLGRKLPRSPWQTIPITREFQTITRLQTIPIPIPRELSTITRLQENCKP